MKFLQSNMGKCFSGIISCLVVFSIVFAPVSQTLNLKRAEAITVWDPGNYVANYGSWIESAASAAYDKVISAATDRLAIKEYVLDGIVWALINLMLEQMIKSTTQWVAGGFEGNGPAFVQDLQGFVMGLADKVAGDFIAGSSLSALCSPFKLQIQAALKVQYGKSSQYQAKCTLTSVVNNVSNFMEGDFLSGGWNEWFTMTQVPGNNQYGALMEADMAMTATIRNAKGEEVKLLDFGKGLMSLKDANGKVITPGTSIESTLNEAINTPGKRLTVADEIDELLGQLIAQLVSTVLTGAGGLAGLGTSGQNSSYFANTATEATVQGSTGGATTLFDQDIAALTEYIGYQNTILNIILDAENYAINTTLNTCVQAPDNELSQTLKNRRATASSALSGANAILSKINKYKADYTALSTNADPDLLSEYGATDVATAQYNLVTKYQSEITSAGILEDTIRMNNDLRIGTTIPTIQREAQTFKSAISRLVAQCPTTP